MDEFELTQQEIIAIINSDDKPSEKKEKLEHYHDSDIASIFPLISTSERTALYKILGKQRTSDVFTCLDDVSEYVEELGSETVADLLELMDADDAIDVLEELDEEDKKEIVELMEEEAAEDVKLISSFDDDLIGSKMTTNYIIVRRHNSIKEAMRHLIEYAKDNDNIMIIFVRDENNKFYGSIDLKDLIIAREGTDLESLIHTQYPYVHATDTVDDCINDLKEYDMDLFPVLNEADELIGVITKGDIVEVVEEEAAEDYVKFAAVNGEEELNESLLKSIGKRLPWLLLLLGLGLVVSLISSSFEGVVNAIPMVVFFQTVVLDMSGNVGTQSLAITIRELTDDDLTPKKGLKMVFKEIRVGFFNGLILGVLSFGAVLAFLCIRHQPITGDEFVLFDGIKVAGSVCVALICALTIAALFGTIIPLFFKKIKVDPAVASGPLITTINDVVAIVCYYTLAMLFFNLLGV